MIMHCYYNNDVPNLGKHCTYCGQPLEIQIIMGLVLYRSYSR